MKPLRARAIRTGHAMRLGLSLGLLLGLVSQAPAIWLGNILSQTTHGRVQLQDARGPIWQGNAQVLLGAGPQAPSSALALPGRLAWQMKPDWDRDWGPVLRTELWADCCLPRQSLRLGWSTHRGWQLAWDGPPSHWPAAWLIGLGAPWNTLAAQGELRLTPQALVWHGRPGQWQMSGQVELDWYRFSSRLATIQPLGNYRVLIQGDGPSTKVQLRTLQGVLQLQGEGDWQNGHLQFSGEAQAEKDAETALSNLLNVLGQRQGPKSLLRIG